MDAKQYELELLNRCLYVERPEYVDCSIEKPSDIFWTLIHNRNISNEDGCEILNGSRKRDLVIPRQVAHAMSMAYGYKNRKPWSLAMIGEAMGNKDHATVINSCKRVSNMIDTKDPYLGDIDATLIDIGITKKDLHYNPASIHYSLRKID